MNRFDGLEPGEEPTDIEKIKKRIKSLVVKWADAGLTEKTADVDIAEAVEDLKKNFGKLAPNKTFLKNALKAEMVRRRKQDDADTGKFTYKPKGKYGTIFDRYAVVSVSGKTVVFDRTSRTFAKPHDIVALYGSTPAPELDIDGNQKGIGKWWLEHPARDTYTDGVCLAVNETANDNTLNLWSGWGVEAKEGDCQIIIDHITKVLARGVQKHADYIIKWMAWGVQNADIPIGTALVVHGEPGAGKGVIGRALCGIYGHHHSYHAQSEGEVTGKFTGHLRDTIMLFADEVSLTEKRTLGQLKAMITESYRKLEFKGIDATPMKNLLRIYVSTNADHAARIEARDRRFAVFEAADTLIKDTGHFDKLWAFVNGSELGCFLHYLMNYDLGDFRPADIPKTTARNAQKLLSLDPIAQWWYDELQTAQIVQTGRAHWVTHADQISGSDAPADKPNDNSGGNSGDYVQWETSGFRANGGALMVLLEQWWQRRRIAGEVPGVREVYDFLREVTDGDYRSNGSIIFKIDPLDEAMAKFAKKVNVDTFAVSGKLV